MGGEEASKPGIELPDIELRVGKEKDYLSPFHLVHGLGHAFLVTPSMGDDDRDAREGDMEPGGGDLEGRDARDYLPGEVPDPASMGSPVERRTASVWSLPRFL